MRKTLFLCLAMAIAMMIMPSCKKDNATLIVGTWEIVEAKMEGETMPQQTGKTFEFKNDGTFKGSIYAGILSPANGKYVLSDNILTIKDLDYDEEEIFDCSFELKVEEITSKEMSLSGTIIGASIDNPTFHWNNVVSFKLKKK